jgi:myo-inositol-1(or 4)-monophosphatase
VYAPVTGELYSAERGVGAWRDGVPLRVSATARLIEALGATGFACVRARRQPDGVPLFARALYRLRGVRRLGSAALDLCLVAEGKLDLYWELNIRPWDIAAGMLVLAEAGGRATDYLGGSECERRGEIIATNGRLHDEFLAIVRDVFPHGAARTA